MFLLRLLTAAFGTKRRSLPCTQIGRYRSEADIDRFGAEEIDEGEMVEANKGRIDQAYDALRGEINPDQRFAMPRTRQALQAVEQARARAGWENHRC